MKQLPDWAGEFVLGAAGGAERVAECQGGGASGAVRTFRGGGGVSAAGDGRERRS